MTQPTSFKGLLPPPKTELGRYEWMNKAWIMMNQLLQAKMNATYPGFVLTPNASQTLLQDYRIGGSSVILLTPKTASAAAELGAGTLVVGEPVAGGVNIGHNNSAVADRIFDIVIVG